MYHLSRSARVARIVVLITIVLAVLPAAAQQWANNGTHIYNTNTGNVGIGTTAPVNPLVLSSGTFPFFQINTTGTCGACNPGFTFTLFGTSRAYIGAAGNTDGGIPGTVAGDMYLRAENRKILFSVDAGVSSALTVTSTGATFKGILQADNVRANYQDVAEWVPARVGLDAGTVVIVDDEHSNQVKASERAYDTRVAGVVSDLPGVLLGIPGDEKEKIATAGRVRVKVDATHRAIKIGDLLVTSGIEGLAMVSRPIKLGDAEIHRPGTILGKALEPLASGRGEILVLLSLQ